MNGFFTLKRKNEKFKVIFDMDDVLADFLGYVLPLLNSTYGKNLQRDDITCWSLSNYYESDFMDLLNQEGLFESLQPKNDALSEFPKIYNNPDLDVWIVTACMTPLGYLEKLNWLERYFPDFPLHRVIPCREKDTVWADAIVDDGLHNLRDFEFIGEPIVYDMPHNRHFEDGTPVAYKRIECLKQARKYLEDKAMLKLSNA